MAFRGAHGKTGLSEQNSPATVYLLSVLENKTKEETFFGGETDVARVTKAFASLSEIAPRCGIFSPVLKLIKEELYSAVYSDTLTTAERSISSTHKQERNSQLVPQLDRVPYFVLLKRLKDHRNQNAEELLNEISELKNRLEKLEGVKVTKQKEIDNLNDQLSKIKTELSDSKKQVLDLNQTIERLQKQMLDIKREALEKEEQFQEELNCALDKKRLLQEDNNSLRPYKNSYDTLKDMFDLPPDKRPRRGFRRPILATKKTQLLSSIEAASKLEQQILEIQNKTLEEYDKHLEDAKEKLSGKKFSESSNDPDYYNEELLLENLEDEMTSRQQNFQRHISGMVVELELVRSHREALQGELSQLEQVEMGGRAVADGDGSVGTMLPSSLAGGRPGSSRMMILEDKKNGRVSEMSLDESGLEEDNSKLNDPSSDPFNPQERVMSKYSAMMYTSVNGGKSFDEVTFAKFCVSCGEKTTICPHKVTKEDMILRLPKRCTHVKLSRPQVRVAISISQGAPPTASTMHPGRPGADTWLSTRAEPHGWDASGDWIVEEETRRQLLSIWDDFKSRTGMDKWTLAPVSRDLSHSRVLSLIEQLYASILWQDEHPPPQDDEDGVGTMKDYMYNFISERYQEGEIAPLATFDFITGVLKYAAQDKMILIFGQMMAGNLDGSIFRYIHLVADLIDLIEWKEVKDFHGFAESLYPFLPEEDVDQLVVEYTAFSENKISKCLIMEFLIHVVVKNKEPRIQDTDSRLQTIQVANPGRMKMAEFVAAMESVAPLTNEQLWRKLMRETFKLHKDEDVPLSSVASIASYASLVQVVALLKQHLPEKIEKAREVRRKEVGSKLDNLSQKVSETGRLITIEQVKNLAFNVARQRLAAERKMQSQYDDYFWQSRPNTQDSAEE